MRPISSAPTAACAPPSSSIRREKVIDWCAVVSRIGFIARASSASMRETSQATKREDADRDDQRRQHHREAERRAPTSAATRHCSHSSIAISTAASTHSIQ